MIVDPEATARVEAAYDEAQNKTRAPLVCVLTSASISRDPEFLLAACILALATPLPLLVFTELSAQRIYILQLLVAIVAAVRTTQGAFDPAEVAEWWIPQVLNGLCPRETTIA